MMRNKNQIAIAVRKADNSISLKEEKISFMPNWKWLKTPFFRGMVVLVETMIVGLKALNYSANESFDECCCEEKDIKKESAKEEKNNKKDHEEKKDELST